MSYIGISLLTGIAGCVIVDGLSYFLIGKLPANGHDRSVEASMICLFVYGPVGFIRSFIAGYS